jgi:hydroxyacylglutathione hydrolase
MAAEIHQFLIGSDNFGVLLHDPATGATASIDAGDEAMILAALRGKGWRLTDILVTHHHGDHIAGLEGLKKRLGARVVAPAADSHRIPGVDLAVRDGDHFHLGSFKVEVIDTPGHTVGHVSFYLPEERVLFAGDTLFALGCGRLFEGTPEQMFHSLERLAALPPETRLYCGHEYTLSNGRFALKVDPGNAALAERMRAVEALRAEGRFTLPSTIGIERETNPFLRAGDASIARTIGMQGQPPVAVFAALRELKNKG